MDCVRKNKISLELPRNSVIKYFPDLYECDIQDNIFDSTSIFSSSEKIVVIIPSVDLFKSDCWLSVTVLNTFIEAVKK